MRNHEFRGKVAARVACALASVLAVVFLFSGTMAEAAESANVTSSGKAKVKAEEITPQAAQGLDYLFDVLNKGTAFDATRLTGLFDYLDAGGFNAENVALPKRYDGQGILLTSEVNSSLDRILRYFYNPDIPNYLLVPSVLRVSGWRDGSEIVTRGRGLWDDLAELSEPVLVRGREFEVCTPDSFAESYYGYDLKRLLVLVKYKGRNVFLSISEQDGKSDVGRKGAVLDDAQWQYFYSGIEGINVSMVGWMDTFMYGSGSVQVFMESEDGTMTRTNLFKWLRAGWGGMNVVKRSHIYEGAARAARSFRTVIESDLLAPEELAANIRQAMNLPESEVNALIREYAENFEQRFAANPKLKKREFAKVVRDGGYAEVLDEDQRKGVLALQKLKCLLGMETLVDMCGSAIAGEPAGSESDPVAEAGKTEARSEG
ncbi:hypothetical protein [Pseudodesulfovibrio tunisiensis]|uniref:hypothetical protein n=1 Tax=Pseudodesulfovibrio tunisiensis TaxID=463192 RepID=UPI001FB47AB0|nr:hypothetical protein [Pseudodesulfovibrio tunisiensis]